MPNSEKGVIINVYVETTSKRSNKKLNSDRTSSRAQLLAYAQDLRNARPDRSQTPVEKSEQKQKRIDGRRRSSVVMKKIRILSSRFDGVKRRWSYEPIVTENYGEDEGLRCNQKGKPRFCKRFLCFLKEIVREWPCKNESCCDCSSFAKRH